jgi:flagellar protein FliL
MAEAAAAAAAIEENEEPAPKKKKAGPLLGKLVNGIGIFALSLAAVIAGGYVNEMLHPTPVLKLGADGKITRYIPPPPPKAAEEVPESHEPVNYFAIDPPLVVNFEENAAVRFLQITIEVSSRDQKVIDGVQKHTPVIRNNLLLLISNRDYHSLMSREGKEKLRQEALTEVRSILKKQGVPPIDDLLFTSFVVQ